MKLNVDKFVDDYMLYLDTVFEVDIEGSTGYPFGRENFSGLLREFVVNFKVDGVHLTDMDKGECWKYCGKVFSSCIFADVISNGLNLSGFSMRDAYRILEDRGYFDRHLNSDMKLEEFIWTPVSYMRFMKDIILLSGKDVRNFRGDEEKLYTLSKKFSDMYTEAMEDISKEEKDPDGYKVDFNMLRESMNNALEFSEDSVKYLIHKNLGIGGFSEDTGEESLKTGGKLEFDEGTVYYGK